MKKALVILTAILTAAACSSKKPVTDVNTLPKDVALKPVREAETEDEVLLQKRENIRVMRASIDSLRDSHTCSGTGDWRISPLGSKPCGGPAAYIAYNKEVESEILPRIQEFTRRQAAYNSRRNLFSDCKVEPQPTGIKCESGKPVLIFSDDSQSLNAD